MASGSLTAPRPRPPDSTASAVTPTVAISGSVKIVAATWSSLIGWTASPSVCHMAIRPCMAATEASIITPVQSPAAYTPRRRGPGHPVHLDESLAVQRDPGFLQAQAPGGGHHAHGEQAVRAAHGPAAFQRDHHAVAAPLDRRRAGPAQHRHAAAPEDVLDHHGGVRVLVRQHPFP